LKDSGVSAELKIPASGVGHDPDALSSVRGSNIVGTNNNRPWFKPRTFKLQADPVKAVRFESSDSERVLCQDPRGANVSHNAEELRPEPALVSSTSRGGEPPIGARPSSAAGRMYIARMTAR